MGFHIATHCVSEEKWDSALFFALRDASQSARFRGDLARLFSRARRERWYAGEDNELVRLILAEQHGLGLSFLKEVLDSLADLPSDYAYLKSEMQAFTFGDPADDEKYRLPAIRNLLGA